MLLYLIAIGLVFAGVIYNVVKLYKEFRETMDNSDMEIE